MQLSASTTDQRRLVRLLAVLGTIALILGLLAAPSAAQDGDDDPEVMPARVDGETRFHTAAAIATTTFDTATVAVLATGEDYPDALAASYAAGVADGPLLLTGTDAVPDVTVEALEDLDVRSIVLIGGPSAIGTDVEAGLIDDGYEVLRYEGEDRVTTAAAVATAFGDGGPVGTLEGDRTAILTSGEDFPDALAAGPLAARASLPLLLTPADGTPDVVDDALDELDIDRLIVVGGPSAVSADVVQHHTDRGLTVERFDGADRTETAITVAQNAIERFDFTADTILLARGDDYPDALAASIHGATIGAPLLLAANPDVLSPATEGHLFDLCPDVDVVRAIGGTDAISEAVLGEAVLAAEGCHDDDAPDTGLGSWSAMADAPIERINHSAVWSGEELLVWGGAEQPTDDGAAYDPSDDTWRPIPAAPIDPRWIHQAVWADDRMIVHGGGTGPDHLADCFDDAAAYDPGDDSWVALPPNPHHDAGCGTSAVWTGTEMIVWGGHAGGTGVPEPVDTGAAFDPATDEWRPIAPSPLDARTGHIAVWTDDRMLVVAGTDADQDPRTDGAAYDPATDEWTELPDAPIAARANPTGTWTGAELTLVGGTIDGTSASDGAAYDPVAGTWREIPDLPGTHTDPTAAQGDGLMLVVGGERDGDQPAAAAWDPTAPDWMALADLPGEFRTQHTVTWADDRLLVFGGQDADGTAGGHVWQDDR